MALARHGVAHVAIPVDVQDRSSRRRAFDAQMCRHHTSRVARSAAAARGGRSAPRPPDPERGKKVAILAGQGALGAPTSSSGAETARCAHRQGAARQGRRAGRSPVRDRRHRLLGTRPSQEVFDECDTLLIVGSTLSLHRVLPQARPGARRADRHRCVAHRPALSRLKWASSATRGDAQRAERAARPQDDRSFLEQAQEWKARWSGAERGADRPGCR